MVKGAALVVVVAFLSVEAMAQVPGPAPINSKEAAIRRLLQVTGAGRLGVQVVDNMMVSFKKAFPAVPEGVWAEFRSEIREDDLTALCVPIYSKHFTEDEVQSLLAFYETPLGKRLIEVQPVVLQESMQVGQEWGRMIAQRVIDRLKQRGYQVPATGA